MTAQLLKGNPLALEGQQKLQRLIQLQTQTGQRVPHLVVILVGNDPASELYVKKKSQACEATGITSEIRHLEETTTTESLLTIIDELNDNPNVDGILVQLPLPEHIDKYKVVEQINFLKDVDGFHPYNLGRLAQQNPLFRPCTPAGIMALLKHLEIPLSSLNATVIGTSLIVGKPMALELLMADCTVQMCHQLTKNLKKAVEEADIVISAVGKPQLIPGTWIKPGAIVIDVGINRMDNGTLIGDIDFEEASKRASWITPVPGGVGPMTVMHLLQNTYQAYEINRMRGEQ